MLSHISTKTQTSHSSWQYVKLGTTASYDNIHREFLKHLGPRDYLWFIDFFMQNMDKNQLRGLKAARLSRPWAALAWMLVWGRLGSGDRGTSPMGDEPWA